MRGQRAIKRGTVILIAGFAFFAALNILARLSTQFSDFYVGKIYPVISTPFIFLSGLLPFSLGELMIALAVAAFFLGIPTLVLFLVLKRRSAGLRKRVLLKLSKTVLWIALYIFATETLGCFIMYQCSTFSDRYLPASEHTSELLLDTLGAVAKRLGELSDEFERDGEGYIVLKTQDYIEDCKTAMSQLAGEYPMLSGYYPSPKPIISSYFMSQQGIIGLYIPFAFEATYNRDTQDISKPCTLCHELSHLKGVIQEDEASFVAILACTRSENTALRYSAYLDAFYYLYSNASELLGTEYEPMLREAVSEVPDAVWEKDLYSYRADYWETNSDKEIIPTETVQAVSEALTDAMLKSNDVEEGILIYYRVTELLMDYYALNQSI